MKNKQNRNQKPTTIDRKELKIGIAVSKWNSEVTEGMLNGAIHQLVAEGVAKQNIKVKYVPGAFELPIMADKLAQMEDMDGVLCLGCLVKGETTHDYHIARAVSQEIMSLGIEHNMPILFGVLTTNTMEQARKRSSAECLTATSNYEKRDVSNKGQDVASSLLFMLDELLEFQE